MPDKPEAWKMEFDFGELARLDALRGRIRDCVADASQTLNWFAEQVVNRERIPLNTWIRLDRPLPKESETLGLAFDVWHAILRSERTLRLWQPEVASSLRAHEGSLRKKLHDLTAAPKPTADRKARRESILRYARRLASDEIYGTFNALSSASVLRSEVFPERSPSTPSYLAGQILISELKVARNQARAHSVSGIRERSPRLAVVSQGVHSLMLYIEHLRKRASLFESLSAEMKGLATLDRTIHETRAQHPTIGKAWAGYVKIAVTRLASLCGDCASLLLATRGFFQEWQDRLRHLAEGGTVSLESLETTLKEAGETFRRSDPAKKQQIQETVYHDSADFCHSLHGQIKDVHLKLLEVFQMREANDYDDLINRLEALKKALDHLEETHRANTDPGEYPSIRDAARFQFPKMLIRQFSEDNEKDRQLIRKDQLGDDSYREWILKNVRFLKTMYNLSIDDKATLDVEACSVVRALGDSVIGRNVLEWWKNYEECYYSPASSAHHGNNPAIDTSWMSLRHRSFKAIAELAQSTAVSANFEQLRAALEKALIEERAVAERIEVLVKELTQWCSARGYQLLLAGKNGFSQAADPLELAAALWIADRLGEPWDERLEQEAYEVIAALQRPDGSFGAVAPLYHNRGFTFYLPSASTIGLLARFVTGGTAAPRSPTLRARLKRWAPVLTKGAEFLVNTMVGREQRIRSRSVASNRAGWHSDRHPEAERIDCLATTDAVTALCRLDDALKWLINLQSIGDFRVSWPEEPRWGSAVPTDCEAGNEQLLLKMASLIDRLRESTEPYAAASKRREAELSSHAFMFYGPPGTGKTYCQELIAGQLGWPVVTLIPVDFLRDGADRVVRRTDEVFDRLKYLSNVCIVFDEFDEMVTNRSGRARPPWLTASMLPLLTDLRERARRQCCALSFTTNYIEQIDQAATRVGRIDERILITYPDFSSRLLLALIETGSAQPPGQVDFRDLTRWAMNTALCSQPAVAMYMKCEITNLARKLQNLPVKGVKCEKPRSPIDATYYSGLKKKSEEVTVGVRKLFRSIGDDDIVEQWLKENKDWDLPYHQLNRRKLPRKSPDGDMEVQLDQTLATVVNFSQSGCLVRTAQDRTDLEKLPDSVEVCNEATGSKIKGRPVWIRDEAGGTWYGIEIDVSARDSWQQELSLSSAPITDPG